MTVLEGEIALNFTLEAFTSVLDFTSDFGHNDLAPAEEKTGSEVSVYSLNVAN